MERTNTPSAHVLKVKIVNGCAAIMARHMAKVASMIIVHLTIIVSQAMVDAWEGVVMMAIIVVTTITAGTTTRVVITIIATATKSVVVMTLEAVPRIGAN